MVFNLAKIPNVGGRNINANKQVAKITFTCHNILRQRASGFTGNMEKKSQDKDFTITYLGSQSAIKREDAIKMIEDSARVNGLEYKKFTPSDPEYWYGVIGPYLCFFSALGLRYTELRTGHSHMPIERSDDGTKPLPVFKYGLYGSHHILLEGCTFPPEKRSSMVQSLGPMTILLCYLRLDGKYEEKWKRAMSHIPLTDEILTAMKDKHASECSKIISKLADIMLLTTSRQAHRAFFPVFITAESCSTRRGN
jgi:hypothetical protein